jgi:hypothetical protein
MKNAMKRKNRKKSRQQGSALLVSLMVMVGLSLLGLGFVAISETESAIAVNERNATQALAAAEAGAKIAVEWFQDAEWADAHGLLPPNKKEIKTFRTTTPNGNGYYKENAGELLFDVPFKIVDSNRFFGNVNTADVIITLGDNKVADDFLEELNEKLFADDSVRISDIRAYAPPMPGGTLVDEGAGDDTGFWQPNATTKAVYGVATIRVTAQKMAGDRVLATRTVKLVVAETPFPTVDGAIETSGSLVGQGNFHVFWGKVLSEKETQVNRPAVGMPWFDAENQMSYEYGYNTTEEWVASTAYKKDDRIHAPNSAIALDSQLAKFSYVAVAAGTSHTNPPVDVTDWKKVENATFFEASGMEWRAEPSVPYRIVSTDFYTKVPWLYALLGQAIEDPWLHVRARGAVTLDNKKSIPCAKATEPHPCDFAALTDAVNGLYSNVFQLQTHLDTVNNPPERLEVFFPTMDYEFWKTVAQSGDNQPGGDLYYFSYNEKTQMFVGPNGEEKVVEDWLNARENGLGAGFYFFDTADETNPQYGKGGTLTDPIIVNAKDGKNWQMQGYIYLNAESFGTTGAGNMIEDDLYQMPGEPYRDIGYREVDPDTGKYVIEGAATTLPLGDYKVVGGNNGIWSYQDVNDNGVFDWHVALNTKELKRPNGGTIAANTVWLPVPWFPDCTIPDLSDMENKVAGTCSEPHEPYVNMIYPNTGDAKDGVTIGWHDPDDEDFRKPKTRLGVNDPVVCDDDTSLRDCTSNGYDVDGALVTLAPILYGALYNEGGYAGSGNATYYGAVLMRGNFDASGTPEVFFNECLARGCLESQLEMQRVMVTLYETDQ